MQKKLYFCIMNNVFCTPLKIDTRYDLKGSKQGRITLNPEEDTTVALKDLNLLNDGKKFQIDREAKKKLIDIIQKDCNFFAKCDIIDYSLLVGVHDKTKHP
jgi:1-phosphatidylinositol-4-phosphate 5-kinase